jgi:hypothetical protein
VQQGSKYADNFFRGHQNASNSYMHAMTPDANLNKADACRKANEYISHKMDLFQSRGAGKSNFGRNNYIANHALGMALHTVMDNRSPAHVGFQKWDSSQIGKHGNNIPFTPFGSATVEDLNSLMLNPKLVEDILNDMSSVINDGVGLNCSCYN